MEGANRGRLLNAGVAAGLLFFAVTFVEIFARPGFDVTRHAVSMLSLGARGWVMKATFIATGALTLACAAGLRRASGRVAGPLLVALYGAGFIAAGLFDAPPALGFPVGTAPDQAPVMTSAAMAHGAAFMVAFWSLIIACFVFAFGFARGGAPGAAGLSAAAGLAMPALIALGLSGVIATGIAFYIGGMLGWTWLGWIALRHR